MMRFHIIRHFLSSFVLCLLLLGETSAEQATTTVIDILSFNPEFSIFLRILQRNQLIPYINQLENITLVAPINSAFAALYPNIASNEVVTAFSMEELSRYIISEPLNSNHTQGFYIYHTKAYQNDQDINHFSTLTYPLSLEIKDNSFLLNNVSVVERDLYAETQNSYVQGTVGTFDHILSLKESLSQISETYQFQSLIESASSFELTNKTVFAFKDSASSFSESQMKYLRNEKYGKDDTAYILSSLFLEGYVGGVSNLTISDLNGFQTEIDSENNGSIIYVNSTIQASVSNIIATDGIIHIFEAPEIIQKIENNALKTLVGLDCSSFVEELLFQGLEELLTDNTLKQTIFHSKDTYDSSDDINTNEAKVKIQSKGENLYHFVKDVNYKDLENLNTTLFTTKYCSSKKLGSKDHCQRLKIGKIGEDLLIINNNVLVESGPFTVGETSIYLIDEDLSVPHDLVSSVSPVFECSRSLGYLHSLGLHKLQNHVNGYTYFLPCFNSLDNFALTLQYLEANQDLLTTMMKGIIMENLLYSDYMGGDFNSTSLDGEVVELSHFDLNRTDLIFDYNGINIDLNRLDDILFDQGVAHPIDKFIIPDSLDIQNTDILTAFDTRLFQKYLSFFPHLSEMVNNHTLLVPSGLSLSKFEFEKNRTLEDLLEIHILPRESTLKILNCGEMTQDIRTLNPKLNLTCTRPSNHDTFLSVMGNEEVTSRVRILTKGCINNVNDLCIFEIDKPIESNSGHFHISLPGMAFAVGILLGSLSMVFILVCLMMVIARTKSALRKKSEGDGNGTTEQEVDENTVLTGSSVDERTSLLAHSNSNSNINKNKNNNNNNNNNNNINEAGFENGYSAMSNSGPISVRKSSKVDFLV